MAPKKRRKKGGEPQGPSSKEASWKENQGAHAQELDSTGNEAALSKPPPEQQTSAADAQLLLDFQSSFAQTPIQNPVEVIDAASRTAKRKAQSSSAKQKLEAGPKASLIRGDVIYARYTADNQFYYMCVVLRNHGYYSVAKKKSMPACEVHFLDEDGPTLVSHQWILIKEPPRRSLGIYQIIPTHDESDNPDWLGEAG